jgi:hypothetical protein
MSVFSYHGPLLPDSPRYQGRQTDLKKLLRWCQGDVQHYGILLGARQSGKSSLFLRLEQRLTPTHVVSLTDFQALSEASPSRAFGFLAQDIARAFSYPDPGAELADGMTFMNFLAQVLDAHPGQRAVLLIEEMGALPVSTRFALANTLRAIFHARQRPNTRSLARLMVLVAGNMELYDLAYTDVSPFANICETHYLVDLPESDAVVLIQEGLAELDIPTEQGQALGHEIYAFAHGYPYLTQRLGAALEAALDDGQPLSQETIEQSAINLIESGNDTVLKHLKKVLEEHALLPAAQEAMENPPRFNRLEEDLARLELAGFLRPDSGLWQVRNPLFARALRSWLEADKKTRAHALQSGLVRLLNARGAPVGAGFLVSANRVLTCAHVVADALGLPDGAELTGQVTLDFPLLPGQPRMTARVQPLAAYQPGKVDDIAVLTIESGAPSVVRPLSLANPSDTWGRPFRVYGFPTGRDDGAWASGILRGPVSDGRIQLEDTKTTGYAVQPGFSGSPVWDESADGVIGMIVAADTEKNVKAAFMIPARELQKVLKAQVEQGA